jgi:hypothetical protein
LDLLGESKDRSHKGSLASAQNQFLYMDEEGEDNSYEQQDDEEYEEGGDDNENDKNSNSDSDSDEGNFYVPTAVARVSGTTAKPPKDKKPNNKSAKKNKQKQ